MHFGPKSHAVSWSSCLKKPPQRNSSLGQRKAPSPHSKCSFQTSLPLVRMLQRLLGAPWLTLGSCQENSRRGQPAPPSPFLPHSSSISSLSWIPYETLFQCFNWPLTTELSFPRFPWQLWTPPSPWAFPSWFPRKGGEGGLASKPSEVRALVNSSPSPNSSHHYLYISPILPQEYVLLKHTYQNLLYRWAFLGWAVLCSDDFVPSHVVSWFLAI